MHLSPADPNGSLPISGSETEFDGFLSSADSDCRFRLRRVRARDPSLVEKVWAFSRSMRDTIGYWQEFGKRVNACGEQWGNNSFDW